jgi:hypothetical protein
MELNETKSGTLLQPGTELKRIYVCNRRATAATSPT